MIGMHITEAILNACESGEISAESLLRHALRHLQNHCDTCHEEIAKWRSRSVSEASPRLLKLLRDERVPPSGDEEEAEKDLLTLLPLGFPERERKVDRALTRYRSPLLARSLAQESIGELAHDLEEASHLIELAFTILRSGPPTALHREVEAHALAVKAMICRNKADFDQATALFQRARRITSGHEFADWLLAGELDQLEGIFLKDRRDLRRSEGLLRKALARFELLGDKTRQVRTLLVLASVHYYQGRYAQAIESVSRVPELTPSNKYFQVLAAHNRALYLTESGRPKQAAQLLKTHQPHYAELGGVWQLHDLHFHWLAGKISYGLGCHEQAETHLVKARDGFTERATAYDAILVCLDLALVYDATGKTDKVLHLTGMISAELARESLHEESMAAVALFLKAAAKQNLTENFVRRVSHFLQFSRTDPSLKHELIQRE